MRVLLVESYFGGSHRAWAEGYREHSGHAVTLVTLPARWWKWRMRGGAVSLAEQAAALAGDGYRPDVVLASSMIDLALLRTLLEGLWGRVPAVLYLHESQLTYPDSPQMEPDASYQFTNWTSAYVADSVVFNSEYHRGVFFDAIPRMLRGMPDERHGHLVAAVAARSTVLPVGIDLSWVGDRIVDGGAPIVLWNHRWEHDKAPEVFLAAVRCLADEGLEFRLALCGESFRQVPTEFLETAAAYPERIVHFGFAPLAVYRGLLASADVVVSSALQEFFGVAVVEAIAAGAFPVLPDRLAYPELIPLDLHPETLYAGDGLTGALRSAILRRDRSGPFARLSSDMMRFDWSTVAEAYDRHLAAVVAGGSGADAR